MSKNLTEINVLVNKLVTTAVEADCHNIEVLKITKELNDAIEEIYQDRDGYEKLYNDIVKTNYAYIERAKKIIKEAGNGKKL